MIKKNWKKLAYFILICTLYVFLIIYIKQKFEFNINYSYLFLAFVIGYIPVHLTSALMWTYYLKVLGHKVQFKNTAIMELMAGFMKMISPFQLNIPFRAIFLKRFKINSSEVIGFSLLHLILEMSVISAATLLLGLGFKQSISYVFVIPLVIVLLLIIFSSKIEKLISKLRTKIKFKLISKIIKAIEKIAYAGRLCKKRPQVISYAIGFVMIIYLIRAIRITLIARALGAHLPLDYAFYAICFSSVIVTLSRVPGGVGIREVTGMLLLSDVIGTEIALTTFVIDQIIGLSLIAVVGSSLFGLTFKGTMKTFIKSMKTGNKNGI